MDVKKGSARWKGVIWTLTGMILMAVLVVGTTTISDTGITTGGDVNATTVNSAFIAIANDSLNTFDDGQSIELYGITGASKPYIGWHHYDPFSNSYRGVGWFGCHYNLSSGARHQHCSLETLDNSTGTASIETKFEIRYGANLTQGDPDLFARIAGVTDFILGSSVDLQLTGPSSDIESSDPIDLFPDGQNTRSLRIEGNSNGVSLNSTVGYNLTIGDNLFVNGNLQVEGCIVYNLSGTPVVMGNCT